MIRNFKIDWLSGSIIGASIVVVICAALIGTVAAHEVVLVLLIALGIAGAITLVLFLAYRFSTGWLRRRTTERIVISQIATVVRQHLPLATGLSLVAEAESGRARVHLRRVSRLLAQGVPLSQAVAAGYPDCSSIPLSLIIAGEKAGQLPAALDQAEAYLFEREDRRSPDDVSVWSYVVVVMGFAALVVSGIMVAVVPKYKEIFKDFGTALPGMTVHLINLSEFVANSGPFLLFLGVFIVWAVYLSLRPRRISNLAFTSRVADWIRWHTPGWRRVEKGRGMRLMLETMRTAVRSGMSLEPAVGVAGLVDVNDGLRKQWRVFIDRVNSGMNVGQAARQSGLGEVTAVALAGGQRGGQMDAALRYAADYHASLAHRWWLVLRNLAWPVCTLMMGIIVGVVVVALFIPLVALINSVCM